MLQRLMVQSPLHKYDSQLLMDGPQHPHILFGDALFIRHKKELLCLFQVILVLICHADGEIHQPDDVLVMMEFRFDQLQDFLIVNWHWLVYTFKVCLAVVVVVVVVVSVSGNGGAEDAPKERVHYFLVRGEAFIAWPADFRMQISSFQIRSHLRSRQRVHYLSLNFAILSAIVYDAPHHTYTRILYLPVANCNLH